jgi:hypothetical protein
MADQFGNAHQTPRATEALSGWVAVHSRGRRLQSKFLREGNDTSCVQHLVYSLDILAGQPHGKIGLLVACGRIKHGFTVVHMFGPRWCTRGKIYFVLTCILILPWCRCTRVSPHSFAPGCYGERVSLALDRRSSRASHVPLQADHAQAKSSPGQAWWPHQDSRFVKTPSYELENKKI